MKKIFIAILFIISLQSFGQYPTRKYFERMSSVGVIDSGYVKMPGDSIFLYSDNSFVSRTKEYYDQFYMPTIPNGFSNFTLCADGVYRNFVPRSNVAMAVDYANVSNKPSTFPATATTVGSNLLAINNPASASLVRINANGVVVTRTVTEAKLDLSIDQVDNTSDANKPISTAQQTALNNKSTIYFGADAQANDSYVITASPIPSSYTTGMTVIFKATTANTTGCTINVNGLGVKNIVKRVNTTPATGDILAGMFCWLVYDGTNFVLLNPVVN